MWQALQEYLGSFDDAKRGALCKRIVAILPALAQAGVVALSGEILDTPALGI